MKIRSRAANFGLSGIASRILLSLFIVFGTYNPSGRSFYHWVLADGPITPRILVGLLLFGTYASLLYATWELIGFAGMLLVIGICISAAYMLEQANMISLRIPTRAGSSPLPPSASRWAGACPTRCCLLG